MANENLIARTAHPEIYCDLLELIGTEFANNGQAIIDLTEGLLDSDYFFIDKGYSFVSRFIGTQRTEIEIVCVPTSPTEEVLKIKTINIYGSELR